MKQNVIASRDDNERPSFSQTAIAVLSNDLEINR